MEAAAVCTYVLLWPASGELATSARQELLAPLLQTFVGHEGLLGVRSGRVGQPGSELAASVERQEDVQDVPRLA